MENKRQVVGGGSSFTSDLFGPPPKDSSSSSSSSSSLFGSVFGPPSSGPGTYGNHNLRGQYANAKHGTTTDNIQERNKGEGNRLPNKERNNSMYQTETVEPCYLSSSIYYGGQEVYSTRTQTTSSQHAFKKDVEQDDQHGSNLNCASRGNWWQGSLYY